MINAIKDLFGHDVNRLYNSIDHIIHISNYIDPNNLIFLKKTFISDIIQSSSKDDKIVKIDELSNSKLIEVYMEELKKINNYLIKVTFEIYYKNNTEFLELLNMFTYHTPSVDVKLDEFILLYIVFYTSILKYIEIYNSEFELRHELSNEMRNGYELENGYGNEYDDEYDNELENEYENSLQTDILKNDAVKKLLKNLQNRMNLKPFQYFLIPMILLNDFSYEDFDVSYLKNVFYNNIFLKDATKEDIDKVLKNTYKYETFKQFYTHSKDSPIYEYNNVYDMKYSMNFMNCKNVLKNVNEYEYFDTSDHLKKLKKHYDAQMHTLGDVWDIQKAERHAHGNLVEQRIDTYKTLDAIQGACNRLVKLDEKDRKTDNDMKFIEILLSGVCVMNIRHAILIILEKFKGTLYAYIYLPNGASDAHFYKQPIHKITNIFEKFNCDINFVSTTLYKTADDYINEISTSAGNGFQSLLDTSKSMMFNSKNSCMAWCHIFTEIYLKALKFVNTKITPRLVYTYIRTFYHSNEEYNEELAHLLDTFVSNLYLNYNKPIQSTQSSKSLKKSKIGRLGKIDKNCKNIFVDYFKKYMN